MLPATLSAQEKKPISWWYETAAPENQENLQNLLVKVFNEAHPDQELSIDFRGQELDKQLRVAMLSGSGPDIVYTAGPSYVASMAQAGQLLALDDYAQKLGWNDRVLPVFVELGKYNGKLYALPKTYETLGLFYNKTLFAKEGWTPPTTIAELEKLADAMLAKGLVPFAAGNADWRPTNEHYVSIVLNSVAGPDNVHKALKGEIPWTSEPFVKAIDTLNSWWQKGYFGPNYFSLTGEQAFAQLATGTAGMSPTGTWNFQNVPRYFPQNNAEPGFVGFPSDPAVGAPVYALGIGSTFSIAATSQNPDGAAAVIDYVFTDKFYGDMNSVWQGEWNTPLRDLSKVQMSPDVLPLYTETMKTLAASVNAGQYGYTTWTFLPPATVTYLVSGMEEVWLNKITTAQFLEKLDATFKQGAGGGQGSGGAGAGVSAVLCRRSDAIAGRRGLLFGDLRSRMILARCELRLSLGLAFRIMPTEIAMHRLYLVPTLLINVVIILVPALLTVALAFCRWDGISAPTFTGLDNFRALYADRVFWTALTNNIIWTLIFLTVPIGMGLLAAAMLLVARRGSTFFQVIYFLPVVIATAITARVWQGMIYSPVTGVFGLLDRLGIGVANPLSLPTRALYGVAVVDLWHWWGFLCVIFFAALRQVPQEHIEAARLEGAGFFQMMRYVLVPGIMPTITLMMVMTVIWSFLVFDFVYILTQGGPAFSSEVLSTLAYRNAFYDLNVGQAAAVALVISMIGLIATFFYIRLQAREYAE